MEVVVLALVCLSPWPFGSVEPEHEFLLDVGVAALMVLWGAWMLLERELPWRKCPVTACLAALVLIGLWQMIPLPEGLLGRISPARDRLYHQLLPAQPEVLPFGAPRDDPRPPAGSTLSLAPAATRSELLRLLAILLLFAVVRDQVASVANLRRLSLAALVNGSLLAVFGLVQFFSSDPRSVFWTVPTDGDVFGPFVNRNHFAFYMNISIGLGAGLLLARISGRDERGSAPARTHGPGLRLPARGGALLHRRRPSLGRFPEAETLGIVFALALMASSVVVCLSRGGLLALVVSSILGLAIWVHRSRSSTRGRLVLLTPAVALALVSWFGIDRVATRLDALRGDAILKDARFALWTEALPLVRDFPLWGTGLGTYQFVETLHRDDAAHPDVIFEHAHNDYLEMLVEAGLPGLLVIVLAIVLLFRLGLRAVRRDEGRPAGAFALGALIGLATIAIHSFSDFSLHIPANAVFAAVLCAHVCARGQGHEGDALGAPDGRAAVDTDRIPLRMRGLAPAFWALLVVALGLWIVDDGRRKARAEHLRRLSIAEDVSTDPGRFDRKVALIEEAARLTPGDARLGSEAAYAHLNAFGRKRWAMGAPDGLSTARPGIESDAIDRLKREHMVPALRSFLRSRDLCPVRAMAHLNIATSLVDLQSADPQASYLRRVTLLAPGDPWLWYQCGSVALAGGRPREAWADWRRSLELSGTHLEPILDRSREHLGEPEILREVLPDRPELLLEAARYLHPRPDEEQGRRPFLERALTLLQAGPKPAPAVALHRRAIIQRDLRQPLSALESYREALLQEPGRFEWRNEYAELAYEQGRYDEAHQALLTILALQPRNERARGLLDAVARGLAEHR